MIRAFLLLNGPRADEAARPPLELIFVVLGERGGLVGRGRLADDADKGDGSRRSRGNETLIHCGLRILKLEPPHVGSYWIRKECHLRISGGGRRCLAGGS